MKTKIKNLGSAIKHFIFTYESLHDKKKFDIEYLYELYLKYNKEMKREYRKHLRPINRVIVIGSLIALFSGICSAWGYFLAEEMRTGWAIIAFTITLTINVNAIVDNRFREEIKTQIEYRKHLENK